MTKVPVTDLTWNFDPDRGDGGVLVDSVDNDMPEYRPGKSYSLDFVFWENTQDSIAIAEESGGTTGGAHGFTLGGATDTATGATVGSLQGEGSQVSRYEAVREYSRWAGRYSLVEAIDGTPRFSEHTPDDASVDSIVVKLEPDTGLTATESIWVILDDVDDTTTYAEDLARISLDFTVLARGDEYATRANLKADLGSDLI
jgi:hypothetical protein